MATIERDYSNSCAESAYTYDQIANDWDLWQEYVDPDATMTRAEFDAMSINERIALQVEAFGPESSCD